MHSTTTGFSLLVLMAALVSSAAAAEDVRHSSVTTAAPICSYSVRSSYPHDDLAFTQGLSFADGFFFEGTGLIGRSSIRRVDPISGEVLQIYELSDAHFGEGITLLNGQLIQLTWTSGLVFFYDQQSFDLLNTVDHGGIGWGLTNDGHRLIMSDGSSTLSFRDPLSFSELAQVQVSDGNEVAYLNELEFVRGEVLANVYLTNMVARINPDSGRVIAWIDLAGILDPVPAGAGVLNGIAWDDLGERLFVTGKQWPRIFEIELVGCPDLPLFFDSFATGDTAAWSDTVQ